jgi:hypothetical protein
MAEIRIGHLPNVKSVTGQTTQLGTGCEAHTWSQFVFLQLRIHKSNTFLPRQPTQNSPEYILFRLRGFWDIFNFGIP